MRIQNLLRLLRNPINYLYSYIILRMCIVKVNKTKLFRFVVSIMVFKNMNKSDKMYLSLWKSITKRKFFVGYARLRLSNILRRVTRDIEENAPSAKLIFL